MYALLLPENGHFFLLGPFKTADLALAHYKKLPVPPQGTHWRLAPLNAPVIPKVASRKK